MADITTTLDRLLGAHEGGGDEVQYHCPYCLQRSGSESHKPKLRVNVAKGVASCFRCGWGGTVQQIAKDRGVKLTFTSPQTFAPSGNAVYTTVVGLLYPADPAKARPLKPEPLPPEAVPWSSSKMASRYLASRGMSPEMADAWGIRYARAGRYASYLLVPVIQNGVCVYFTSRTVRSGVDAKSMHPKKRDGHHSKTTCLLNYDACMHMPVVSVTEGFFSCVAAHRPEAGYGAVATLGKGISDAQLALMRAMDAKQSREWVVFRDADAGPCETYARMASQLSTVTAVVLPDGDPDDNRARIMAVLGARRRPSLTLDRIAAFVHRHKNICGIDKRPCVG